MLDPRIIGKKETGITKKFVESVMTPDERKITKIMKKNYSELDNEYITLEIERGQNITKDYIIERIINEVTAAVNSANFITMAYADVTIDIHGVFNRQSLVKLDGVDILRDEFRKQIREYNEQLAKEKAEADERKLLDKLLKKYGAPDDSKI